MKLNPGTQVTLYLETKTFECMYIHIDNPKAGNTPDEYYFNMKNLIYQYIDPQSYLNVHEKACSD